MQQRWQLAIRRNPTSFKIRFLSGFTLERISLWPHNSMLCGFFRKNAMRRQSRRR
jgi:hypothetical protein